MQNESLCTFFVLHLPYYGNGHSIVLFCGHCLNDCCGYPLILPGIWLKRCAPFKILLPED
jgi:hypothetical protein